MKKFFSILALVSLLAACSNDGETVTPSENDKKVNDVEEEVLDVEETAEPKPTLTNTFSPYIEQFDFVISDETFDALYYENYKYEDEDPYTWGLGNIDLVKKAADETIYYFSHTHGHKEPALKYEIFTLDENGKATVHDKLYSPTQKQLIEGNENPRSKEYLVDYTLYSLYEHNKVDASENSSVQVTIEKLAMDEQYSAANGRDEAEIIFDHTFHYDDNDSLEFYRLDFGAVVTTSIGPVYVYPDNPNEKSDFNLFPLVDESLPEGTVLKDPYDLTYNTRSILYIDFEQGYYFVYDSSEDGIKRLEIETGEPLYDGATDKVLPLDVYFDYVYPLNEDAFYIHEDEDIYIINNDLQLVNASYFFASEREEDDFDGRLYGPYYLGNNQFLALQKYEYQRKDRLKMSIMTYEP